MGYRCQLIRRMVMMVLLLMAAGACGMAETDALASEPPGQRADQPDEVTQPDDDEADETAPIEVVAHPFEAAPGQEDDGEVDEDSPFGGEPGDGGGDEGCPAWCVKTLWCGDHDEPVDLADCIEGCEYAQAENMVDDEVFDCVQQADSCEATRQCQQRITVCEEVCQFEDNCQEFSGQLQCADWCSDEISAGRMNWDRYGCLIDTVEGACPAFGLCGMNEPDGG